MEQKVGITYFGPTIFDIIPERIKENNSLNSFAESIKMWIRITINWFFTDGR